MRKCYKKHWKCYKKHWDILFCHWKVEGADNMHMLKIKKKDFDGQNPHIKPLKLGRRLHSCVQWTTVPTIYWDGWDCEDLEVVKITIKHYFFIAS